jgi:NAD(P)H-nitrite reductase large subunit
VSKVVDRSIDIGTYCPEADDHLIICRCEEITKGEIRKAIYDGMNTLTELRRFLRTGMGPCQGQSCGKIIQGILARELKVSPLELEPAMSRAPMRPTTMKVFGNEVKGGE